MKMNAKLSNGTPLTRMNEILVGRASLTPAMDVFITLMQLGSTGWKRLTDQRKENFKVIQDMLGKIAQKYGERVLNVKNNPISIGK